MKVRKALIIGAGLSGATVARLLAEKDVQVTVLDKRNTVGGNVYDKTDENGIMVQVYGPHIFHTNVKEVYEFLSRFTEWVPYRHKVLASIKGKHNVTLVPVPFNLTSLFKLYPEKQAEAIKDTLIEEIGYGKKVPILTLRNHEDARIRKFADFVYKNIFYIYTMKQWGFPPEELGEEVTNRVPVYLSEEDGYFTDEYQAMPKNGFTEMVKGILQHPNIHLELGVNADELLYLKDGEIYYDGVKYEEPIVYTGCVDELFEYKFGILPYRSLKFKFKTLNTDSFQPAAVVNYTTNKKYTRISEFTKFACPKKDKTVIVKEYPKKYKDDKDIPYYPVPRKENKELHAKYQAEAQKYSNLYLLGRLAEYKYVNMDIAVKNAIDITEKILEEM